MIVNFMTPGAGVLMLGRDPIGHSEYQYTACVMIAIILRDYNAVFLCQC